MLRSNSTRPSAAALLTLALAAAAGCAATPSGPQRAWKYLAQETQNSSQAMAESCASWAARPRSIFPPSGTG